jgi:hypothetical protein
VVADHPPFEPKVLDRMAYGTGKFLGWLVSQRITPHITVWDKSQ